MGQIFSEEGYVVPVTIIKMLAEVGAELENKAVIVTGKSKGKGFTGVMKKWGFRGSKATRGQSNKQRAPGSIGGQTPGRALKGKKMAGRAGNKKVTVKGLKIVRVMAASQELMVSGPVPGARNSEVTLRIL